jgi:hypothetical protein
MSNVEATVAMTVQEQIECLRNLKQGAAAVLLDISPGTLRGHINAPRNGDTYDAVDLVKWRASRIPRPELSDDETERWLRAIDAVFGCNELAIPEAASVLSDFITKHGDAGRILIADEVLQYVREYADSIEYQQTAKCERKQRQWREVQKRRDEAEAKLDMATVCKCGRMRQGRKWIRPRRRRSSKSRVFALIVLAKGRIVRTRSVLRCAPR